MKHKIDFTVRKHFIGIVFAILISGFAAFQLLYDWHIHQVESYSNDNGQPLISSLIDNAVNGSTAPAPIDAVTGDVYFPDVKLMLPHPNDDLSLRQLDYSNVSNGAALDLQVTTKGILDQSESLLLTAQADAQSKYEDKGKVLTAILQEVPNLQACARGVQLFYSPQNHSDATFKLQFSKKLDNGKTIYGYSETTCQSVLLPVLSKYLKQIQSY